MQQWAVSRPLCYGVLILSHNMFVVSFAFFMLVLLGEWLCPTQAALLSLTDWMITRERIWTSLSHECCQIMQLVFSFYHYWSKEYLNNLHKAELFHWGRNRKRHIAQDPSCLIIKDLSWKSGRTQLKSFMPYMEKLEFCSQKTRKTSWAKTTALHTSGVLSVLLLAWL